jgi:DNA-binding XRE family transcriptional regulator
MYRCYHISMDLAAKAERPQPHYSNHLKVLRTQRGFSQGELAGRAGITRQAVSSIESNLYLPTTSVALQLASVLACRVEDLFSLIPSEKIIEGTLIGHFPPQ